MRLIRRPGDQRGTSTLEFVVVLPMVLLIFLASLELSRAWLTVNIMTNAAREGARWGVVTSPLFDRVAAEARMQDILDAARLTVDNPSVTWTATCTAVSPNPTPADPCPRDSAVLASVTMDFKTVVPLFLTMLTPMPLAAQVTMRRE
jgi:Flp pilus assembly protein TadG